MRPPDLFGRGQQRPLVAGATANIILAHLPPHQLRSVFHRQRERIAAAGLGSDWETLRAKLAAIRQQGYSLSAGEYRAGIAGLAAPLFNRDGEVLGSIALATSTQSPRLERVQGAGTDRDEGGRADFARHRRQRERRRPAGPRAGLNPFSAGWSARFPARRELAGKKVSYNVRIF